MLGRKRNRGKDTKNLQELSTESGWEMDLRKRLSDGVPQMGEISTSSKDYIYLASPYSLNNTSSEQEKECRYKQVARCAYKFLLQGISIYSPIVHYHSIQKVCGNIIKPTKFWLELDFGLLKHSQGMFVLMIDGWSQSIGVKREIEYCRKIELPVTFIHPDAYILNGETSTIDVDGKKNEKH